MKVVIAGSRYKDKENKIAFDDYTQIIKAVTDSNFEITEVVSGCAIGVDKLGEKYARTNNIRIVEMPANWALHGKAAGPIRNQKMAEYADAAVVVWDGHSPGSLNMISEMNRRNKPCFVRVIT